MTDVRQGEMLSVCPTCTEPVIFTFEFPRVEYVCVECGWMGGVMMQSRAPATPERQARYAELNAKYREQAAARGYVVTEPAAAANPPTCGGCDKVAEGPLSGDKPPHWFSRTKDGVTTYACSRGCIPKGDKVLPW